jgi:hypothetical protein
VHAGRSAPVRGDVYGEQVVTEPCGLQPQPAHPVAQPPEPFAVAVGVSTGFWRGTAIGKLPRCKYVYVELPCGVHGWGTRLGV